MNDDIQAGRNCRVMIRPDSPASLEFGEEVAGCIKGRDVVDIGSNDSMETLYDGRIQPMKVIVVEDSTGAEWKIPETDVEKIVCK